MSFTSAEQRAMMDFLARSGGVTAQQVAAPSYVPKTGPVAAPAITPLPAALPYTAPPVNLAPLAAPPPPPSPIMGALMQGAAQQRQFQQQLSAPLYETPAWQGHRRGTGGLDNEQVGFQWSPEATGNILDRYVDPGQATANDLARYVPTYGQTGIPIATPGAASPNSQPFDNITRMTPTGPDGTGAAGAASPQPTYGTAGIPFPTVPDNEPVNSTINAGVTTGGGSVSPQGQNQQAPTTDPTTVSETDLNALADLYAQGGADPANSKALITPYEAEAIRIAGQANFARENERVTTEYPGQIAANNQRISEIDAEIARLSEEEAASGVYPYYNPATNTTIWTDANGNTIRTAEGDQTASTTAPGVNNDEQINALNMEKSELQAQNETLEQRLKIAQGDTYQGRPNPGWSIDSLGDLVSTGLNAIDVGRETTITQIGDQAVQWVLTGEMPPDLALLSGNEAVDTLEALTNRQGYFAGEGYDATFLVGYIEANPDKRDEMLAVYYNGYDANGDGSIDYVGGRAVWEWYAAEMGTAKSILSQIALDPLNATIVAGGAAGVLRGAAGAAMLSRNLTAAKWLGRAATALEWVSRVDDPIWWVYSGPKAAVGRAGRKIGLLNDATGEVISKADRAAANAAAVSGDPAAFTSRVTTPANQVPVHNPVTIGGQQYQQVGNSGATFIGQNADGSFTVYTRDQNGRLTAAESYGTQQEAVTAAVQSEQTLIGALYLSGQDAQAQAYDSAVPVVYQNNVAYVGANAEFRVVYNAQTGEYTVEVQTGRGYNAIPGTYTDPNSAMHAAQTNYLQTGGSTTTGGGVPVGNPRAGAAWTAPNPGGVGTAPAQPQGAGTMGPGGAGTTPGATTPQATITQGQAATTPGGIIMNPAAVGTPGGSWTGRYADGTSFQVTAAPNGQYIVYGPGGQSQPLSANGVMSYLDRVNLTKTAGVSGPTGTGQIGLPPSNSAGVPPQGTGAASSVAPGPAVTSTPDGGAPLDPSLNVRPADVTPNQPVTRGTTSYEYGGTVMMDGQPVATWQVTTADGYIYNVGTTSQSDGSLRIEYTGQQVQPDGSVATVDQPQMVNVGGVTTLDSTAPLIEGHAGTLGPAPGAPLGGAESPPSGAGAVPTEGATDVGAGAAPSTAPSGTGIFPPQAATDDTVAPATGEGSLGGSQTPGEVVGDLGDTAAANVNVGAAPEAEDIRPKVPRIDRPGEAADAARLTRQGDIAPASVEGGIADGTRIMDDAVPAGAAPSPASAAPSPAGAAPSPAGAAPAGAAPSPGAAAPAPRTGMYGGQITARNGATVIDYAPSEIWIDSAVKQVSSRIGDDATAKQIVRDFISSNPRIRESAGEFADALRAGDEVDQALASMELQATLAEEWAHTGMAANYGPVATDYMSPGAAGMSPASATFPTEWPKTGRAIERMATGRGTPNDFGNLARSGFLPGRESDLANMIRSGTLDRFVASTGGRPFILPDGITRLYGDELAAMSPAQRAQLADQVMARMGDPVLSARPGSTQARINDLRDRFNAVTNGAPQRGPVSGAADAPRPQASRPTAPDADTKRVKQDAQAMTPAQEKVKPGTPSPITLTHDWSETTGYIDQFGNSVRKTLKETEELYGHPGVYDSLDPAKRYDIVEVSINKRSSFYTLADEDGILRGYGRTKRQLLKNAADARPDIPLLRVFDGDRLVVSSTKIKSPNTLYTRMVHTGSDGNRAAALRVVQDSDGQFHIVTETADGKRIAVFNDYDDLNAARNDVDRAIQAGGGLDWPMYGPDGGPLFGGKGVKEWETNDLIELVNDEIMARAGLSILDPEMTGRVDTGKLRAQIESVSSLISQTTSKELSYDLRAALDEYRFELWRRTGGDIPTGLASGDGKSLKRRFHGLLEGDRHIKRWVSQWITENDAEFRRIRSQKKSQARRTTGSGGTVYANVPFTPKQIKGMATAVGNEVTVLSRKAKHFVSSVRPTKRPVVPNPKNDGTLAGRLFDEGSIDEAAYKALTSTYKKADGTEVVVQEEIIARMMRYGSLDRAFHEVLDETVAAVMPVRVLGPDGKPLKKSQVADAAGWINEAGRASALYALHRTIPGVAGDTIGNTVTNIMTGNGVANIMQALTPGEAGVILNAVRSGNWESVEESLELFAKAKRNGVTIRIEDFGDVSKYEMPLHGDMPYSRALQRIGVPRKVANAATAPFQFKGAREVRNFGDAVDRLGIAHLQYDRHLFDARVSMVKTVREEAARLGESPDAWHQMFVNLGNDVSLDDIRATFNNNPVLNRAWKQQQATIRDGVLDAVKKYKFIGGRTKLDEGLSKVMYFHYWQSRAILLHAEIAMKNPLLINLYASALEESKERAKELNLPGYLHTWFKFMGSENGWMGFTNALGMMFPLFMLEEMNAGGPDFDVPWVDEVLGLLPFGPFMLGAAMALGQTGRMWDVTYTQGTRNMIRTFINWARAEGIGPLDKYMSPVGDPFDEMQDNFWNWMSKTFGERLGGTEVEQTDARVGDLRMLNLMVDQKMDSLYGPDWREDPALVQIANQAKAAMETGQGHNAVSESVYMAWVRNRRKQAIIRSFMPGQTNYQYGPQLEQRAQLDAIWDKINAGMEITDEEQAILDAASDNALTADARNLNSQLDEYYDIGTQFQRELHQVRNELLYGEAPEGSWVVIDDNEYYSAEEWNAMSTEDRRLAVHKWVAAQGGTDQLNAYYAARDEWRASHPEAGDYLDWREAFRADPVTIHNEMMRISPGYANYINGLSDPTDQDRWFTVEAYYASLGEEYGLNDNPDDPLDPSQANPMQAITGYQSPPQEAPYQPKEKEGDEERETFGSGEWSSEREWRENAPGEYVAAMQQQYEEEVAAVQPVVDDVLEQGGWSWMLGMSYSEIEAESQKKGTSRQYDEALKAIKNAFYFNDITTPTVDMEVRDYNRWRDQRLAADPNADVSPQAYEEAKINSQNAYGVGPQNDPEEQAYQARRDQERQNEAAANWWAYNPNAVPGQGFYPKEQRNPLERYIPVAERGPYQNPYLG